MGTATKTDVLIIGAGPIGLFAVFELGLFDMKCHLIDVLDRPGGQCAELYPDKPIYDIPALPMVTAQELVDRLMQQAAPFKPEFTYNLVVSALEKRDDGSFLVTTDEGERFEATIVVIAAGEGAFQPRRAPIPGIERYEASSVRYSVRRMEELRGHDVVIVGGGDSALDWTLALQPIARKLTLVHRRDEFRAAPDSVAKMRALVVDGKINLVIGQVGALDGAEGRLTSVSVSSSDGDVVVSCTRLLPFFGLSADLGPIADWGLNAGDGTIPVSTETFETSVPGIFAVGDICSYPGKLRLILSGFHEVALMTQAARRIVKPRDRAAFQHTTSSTSLQAKLAGQS